MMDGRQAGRKRTGEMEKMVLVLTRGERSGDREVNGMD